LRLSLRGEGKGVAERETPGKGGWWPGGKGEWEWMWEYKGSECCWRMLGHFRFAGSVMLV
jgi:hypothetical protein